MDISFYINFVSALTLSDMGCQDKALVCGGLKGPPRYMAVLMHNKAYLCYYLAIGISKGITVAIKMKIFDHILKIDRIMEKIFSRIKNSFSFQT